MSHVRGDRIENALNPFFRSNVEKCDNFKYSFFTIVTLPTVISPKVNILEVVTAFQYTVSKLGLIHQPSAPIPAYQWGVAVPSDVTAMVTSHWRVCRLLMDLLMPESREEYRSEPRRGGMAEWLDVMNGHRLC